MRHGQVRSMCVHTSSRWWRSGCFRWPWPRPTWSLTWEFVTFRSTTIFIVTLWCSRKPVWRWRHRWTSSIARQWWRLDWTSWSGAFDDVIRSWNEVIDWERCPLTQHVRIYHSHPAQNQHNCSFIVSWTVYLNLWLKRSISISFEAAIKFTRLYFDTRCAVKQQFFY